ncbi:MAG: prephenate dehydrogenase [Terriglobales bacterium]
MDIRQITIIGTGLIGGSFGLAVRAHGFRGRIVGCDRDEVLAEAQALDAIDAGCSDPIHAARGSDLVLLATPVGGIIELLEMGQVFPDHALITDVGSTKQEIILQARRVFGPQAPSRFLPGHPMAGKEHSGIQYASADLFEGAVWLVTPMPQQDIWTGRSGAFVELVRAIGARVVTMDPHRHDRLCAWISHLPQMISTALAASLEDEFGDNPELKAIGGRALREMTRIASSPYSMWRDIALTNTANIEEALLRMEQRLAHLRENLRTRELESEFQRAQQFKKK